MSFKKLISMLMRVICIISCHMSLQLSSVTLVLHYRFILISYRFAYLLYGKRLLAIFLKHTYLLNPLRVGSHIKLQPKNANAFCLLQGKLRDFAPTPSETFQVEIANVCMCLCTCVCVCLL